MFHHIGLCDLLSIAGLNSFDLICHDDCGHGGDRQCLTIPSGEFGAEPELRRQRIMILSALPLCVTYSSFRTAAQT
jgi:hypothetical protein